MVDPRTLVHDFIHKGDLVKIKHPSNSSGLIEGHVDKILSEESIDKDGIEVQLMDPPWIGNIKEIIFSNSNEDIKKRIFSRESSTLEKKETFSYDVKNNKQDNSLREVVAIAIVSLINTCGGHVYIGVTDENEIKGLTRDYTILGNSDTFEIKLKGAIKSYLGVDFPISNYVDVSFPIIDGHEICQIEVTASDKPIFHIVKTYNVTISEKVIQRRFTDFYVRDGNAKKLVESHQEFVSHFEDRFK